jgi:hypothetical protein
MSIQEKKSLPYEYNRADCDACGESLLLDDPRDDIGYAHHAALTPKFGYGHPYDSMHSGGGVVVCGACWQKVLITLDLPVFTEAWGTKYMADGRVVREGDTEKHERECLKPEYRDKPLKTSWDPDPGKKDYDRG